MNLIEKWKNRETKKKLREENLRLKEENKCLKNIPVPNVCTIERNVQKVRGSFCVPTRSEKHLPSEVIKEEIAYAMIKSLIPFIEYDFEETRMGKQYIGALYVATGSKRWDDVKS